MGCSSSWWSTTGTASTTTTTTNGTDSFLFFFSLGVEDSIKSSLKDISGNLVSFAQIFHALSNGFSLLWVLGLQGINQQRGFKGVEILPLARLSEFEDLLFIIQQDVINEGLFNFVSDEGLDDVLEEFRSLEVQEKIDFMAVELVIFLQFSSFIKSIPFFKEFPEIVILTIVNIATILQSHQGFLDIKQLRDGINNLHIG
mmetsp:Transcript_24063/g.21104  ORF Transcript_24063/g.21104 Transcript_24063/m.21104 type:complete len:200 (+) Transcript_24063:2673-3272(+)